MYITYTKLNTELFAPNSKLKFNYIKYLPQSANTNKNLCSISFEYLISSIDGNLFISTKVQTISYLQIFSCKKSISNTKYFMIS